MSVSSINPYLSALAAQYTASVTAATDTTQTSSNTNSIQATNGLDTFELSAPPITFSGYDSSGNATGGSSLHTDIQSFLEKVKNGTVTDDDIKQLQAELKQASQASGASQTASATASTSSSSDLGSDIKSFLDKVKDGSVTTSDIQSMQAELQQAGPPPGPSPASNSDSGSASLKTDIKNFLDKVKDGSVTQSDIQSMQTELQQAQQTGGSDTTKHHHHHEGGSGSSSSFGTDLTSFLDKVANGTLTDSDLTAFQSELQQQSSAS